MTEFDSTSTVVIDADAQPLQDELARVKTSIHKTTELGRQFGTVMSSAFTGLALQGRSFNDVLRNVGLSLSKIALDAAMKPLGNALSQAFSTAITGAGTAFTSGGVMSAGTPVPFASGGIISAPMTFPLGRGTGLAGERGAEAILPLARGPDGRLGVAASGGGGNINVTFNVTTPDADSFRRSETQLAALLARTVGRGQRNM